MLVFYIQAKKTLKNKLNEYKRGTKNQRKIQS